jgi:S1-C subfamily serine protease
MKTVVALVMGILVAAPALAQDTGWIGTTIADQADRGVLVRSVEANSPAERAGLRVNDVILQYNKEDVVGVRQFTRLVGETPVGRSVDIMVRRDNRDQTLKVTAEKAPFPLNALHIDTPNLTVFRENLGDQLRFRTNQNHVFTPFEVLTSVTTAQGGIRVDSLTPQLRDFFGVKSGEGVLVASVEENSAAGRAGLKAGDVITAVDGRIISAPQELNQEMRSRSSGFTLKVVRNKMERDIRVD